jgi:tripeptide aminopeptidase
MLYAMKYIDKKASDELLDRFLRYVQIWSTSDSAQADRGIQPSTPRQIDFARRLATELSEIGVRDIKVTDHCYIFGQLPATPGYEKIPAIGLLAHIDTVEEVSGENVKPQVHVQYDGEKIILSHNIELDPAKDRALAQAAGNRETIITSDGSTLLGADDKAGVASIMTAIDCLHKHPEIAHGKIEILFSPDEETGHGMDNVPLSLLTAKCCYTVDGGHIGELETECFNAYKSDITFTGTSKHTGTARPDMVNALTTAAAFVTSLPRHEAPETTDGFQGFYAPMSMEGSIETAHVCLILRDFSSDGMKKRCALVDQLAQAVATSFGAKAEVVHTRQYLNMKSGMDAHPAVVKNLIAAYRESGIEPVFPPIRGGTDGSRLTEQGIPTPNIFTGGHNYHSRMEWCSLEQMSASCNVLINLAAISAVEQ